LVKSDHGENPVKNYQKKTDYRCTEIKKYYLIILFKRGGVDFRIIL
jgi:hypothetical protein